MNGVDWNPRNLVEEKISTCKGEDHEGKRRGVECRLVMILFNDAEAIGEIQLYQKGTEKYYCIECYEDLL